MTRRLPTWKESCLLGALTIAAICVHGYHPATEDAERYTPGILKALRPSLFPYNAQFFEAHARMSLFPNLIAESIRVTRMPKRRCCRAQRGSAHVTSHRLAASAIASSCSRPQAPSNGRSSAPFAASVANRASAIALSKSSP